MFETVPELELMRLAAFIDGEGSIVLGVQEGRCRNLRLQLCNTDPRLITWAKELFGGTITKEERSVRKTKGNERNIFRWHVSSKQAEILLKAVYPFLLLKKEQAEVALAYRSTVGNQWDKVPSEVKAKRVELSEELSRLKRINYSVVDFSETPNPFESALPN